MTNTNKIFFAGTFLGLFFMYAGLFSMATDRFNPDAGYAMFLSGVIGTGSIGLMRMTTDLYASK